MEPLSSTCQRLYAELLNTCLQGAAPRGRGISFVSKKVHGRKYWYLQFTVGSGKTQHYLGPESEALLRRIEEEKALWREAAPEIGSRRRLVASLAQAGASTPTTAEARVLEVLERAGVFRVGGVLVGSMAFRLYGNMLGFEWSRAGTLTEDVDIAQDYRTEIAIDSGPVNLRDELLHAGLGLFEIPALDRKSPSTRFKIRGQSFSVDLITPLRGKPQSEPIPVPSLGAMAMPMRYLDYLLEDMQPAAVVSGSGILVNVPAPGRFALHKFVLARRRPPAWQAKAAKDMAQAIELTEALLDLRPADLTLAYEAAHEMPSAFMRELNAGLRRGPKHLKKRLIAEAEIPV